MILRRCLDVYLVQSARIWRRLPSFLRLSSLGEAYGRHLHGIVCRSAKRNQNHSTFFLRNRAELELIRRLIAEQPQGASLSITVLACSKGAEVYSFLWTIRRARPDLTVNLHAVDISQEIVDFAKEGIYFLKSRDTLNALAHAGATEEERLAWNTYRDQGPLQNVSLFERMNESEMQAMFDCEGNHATVKPWLKAGITWQMGDATSPQLIDMLGPQDFVVANRFLCHMEPQAAESCLRNIAGLVKPGGYIFVSGVDLDVRAKVAREMGWEPVGELIREVHDGDFSIRNGWPMNWWGLEPFSQNRPDWKIRYACVFQVGKAPSLQPVGAPPQLLGSVR